MIKKAKSKKTKFKRIIVNCFLLFTFCFLFFSSSAQSVSATLDRDKILLGEQVTFTLTLTNLNTASTLVSSWPQPADTLNHLEILQRSQIDTVSVNGTVTYQQKFTITSFDSGRWQAGPFNVVIQERATGKQTQLATVPLYIAVLPVDVSSLQDFHPIKDIIDVETTFNWLPVIIAIAIILIAIIIFIIIKNRKKKPSPIKVIAKGTPLERALEKLYALDKQSLTSPEEIKKFHSEIDIITREYFQEMMHVNALQLTASELFSRINVYMQHAELRQKFQELFAMNSAVKYAKYFPQQQESKNTLKGIIRCLEQTDESINRARTNADTMVSKY